MKVLPGSNKGAILPCFGRRSKPTINRHKKSDTNEVTPKSWTHV